MTQCPFPTEHVGTYRKIFDGHGWTFIFSNSYGASVVCHKHSYGFPYLWELAVLKDGNLCYTTPITDNVVGHLTEDEVAWFLEKIANLRS